MKPPTSSDEMDTLFALYAIGALGGDERRLVAAHLVEHPEARTEVAAYRQAANRLRSPEGPSPELWERIAEEIHAEPTPGTSRPKAMVIALDERRRAHPRLLQIAAVAAAVASLAGTAAALSSGGTDTPTSPTAPAASSLALQAQQALATPGAQRGTVVAADGTASADVVVLPSGRGYVLDLQGPTGSQLIAQTPTGPVLVAVLHGSVPIAFELPASTTGLVVATTAAETTGPNPGIPTTPGGASSTPATIPLTVDPGTARSSAPTTPSLPLTLPGGLSATASSLTGLLTLPTAPKH